MRGAQRISGRQEMSGLICGLVRLIHSWVLTCTTQRKENMVTFYHCSVCGMALETASVEPNYETHEIIIRLVPCSVCRPTQNAQDRAKRPLTGRNGKPTNVLADGTVLPIACNLNR